MGAEGLEVVRWGRRRGDRVPQGCQDPRVAQVCLRGRTLQRLADDLGGIEGDAEQQLGDLGDLALLLFRGPATGHGGRGADTGDVVTTKRLTAAPDQEGHIGALAPAVGVQLVEDQEPQPLRRSHQFAVLGAREQQLQHHVVGEQDVRRVAADRLTGLALLLAGVAGEAYRGAIRVAEVQELGEFFLLAVGQGIHRVDHNGLDAPTRPVAQHMVHDGDYVGQALPGPGAAGQDIGLALLGLEDRLALVGVELEGLAGEVRNGLVEPEDAGALRMERALADQIVNRAAWQEGGVELEHRLGPEGASVQLGLHLGQDPRVRDLDEAGRVARVVVYQTLAEVEHVHPVAPSFGTGAAPLGSGVEASGPIGPQRLPRRGPLRRQDRYRRRTMRRGGR